MTIRKLDTVPLVCRFVVWALVLWPVTAAAQARLPSQVTMQDVQISLELQRGGGGCVERCMAYRIVIDGAGTVDFTDFGDEPRMAPIRRTIPVPQALSVLNEFLAARFVGAPSNYGHLPVARSSGALIHFEERIRVDGAIWLLALRIGDFQKSVALGAFPPADMERLRVLVDVIGRAAGAAGGR